MKDIQVMMRGKANVVSALSDWFHLPVSTMWKLILIAVMVFRLEIMPLCFTPLLFCARSFV